MVHVDTEGAARDEGAGAVGSDDADDDDGGVGGAADDTDDGGDGGNKAAIFFLPLQLIGLAKGFTGFGKLT